MFKKTSKTLYYMKIMVCKIPPGGAEPFLAIGLSVRCNMMDNLTAEVKCKLLTGTYILQGNRYLTQS